MAHDPYAALPQVPELTVFSNDVTDGKELPPAQRVAGPDDLGTSPHVSWSEFPAETRGFVVTMYDPDAPTVSGFWHWAVANIPVEVTELATGVGTPDGSRLPAGSVQLRHDGGEPGFMGAAPPPGHGPHRYFLVVHAVDTDRLDVTADTTPARLGSQLFRHTLARGRMIMTFER